MVRVITLSTPLPPRDNEEYIQRQSDQHWLEQAIITQAINTNRKTKLEEDEPIKAAYGWRSEKSD